MVGECRWNMGLRGADVTAIADGMAHAARTARGEQRFERRASDRQVLRTVEPETGAGEGSCGVGVCRDDHRFVAQRSRGGGALGGRELVKRAGRIESLREATPSEPEPGVHEVEGLAARAPELVVTGRSPRGQQIERQEHIFVEEFLPVR